MKTKEEILTAEKLKDIYTNESFRNSVAHAHQCCDKYSVFMHFLALDYPRRYIVTEEQINEAKAEVLRAKEEAIKNLGNKLVFVGMGGTYEPRYDGDLCNHRIRTEFKNNKGKQFFIEVGTGRVQEMHITHSIDRTRQKELNSNPNRQSEFYNYKKLEMGGSQPQYNKQNLLSLINTNFDCNFTQIEVDNYTLTTDDFICQSK